MHSPSPDSPAPSMTAVSGKSDIDHTCLIASTQAPCLHRQTCGTEDRSMHLLVAAAFFIGVLSLTQWLVRRRLDVHLRDQEGLD